MPSFSVQEGKIDLLTDGRDQDVRFNDEFRTGDGDGPAPAALVRFAQFHADALHAHDLTVLRR